MNNVLDFKRKMLEKFKPDQIIEMWKKIVSDAIGQTEDSGSEVGTNNDLVYNQVDEDLGFECGICLATGEDNEEYEHALDSKPMTLVSCWHGYHMSCMVKLIKEKKSLNIVCPCCKVQIAQKDIEQLDEFVYIRWGTNKCSDLIN